MTVHILHDSLDRRRVTGGHQRRSVGKQVVDEYKKLQQIGLQHQFTARHHTMIVFGYAGVLDAKVSQLLSIQREQIPLAVLSCREAGSQIQIFCIIFPEKGRGYMYVNPFIRLFCPIDRLVDLPVIDYHKGTGRQMIKSLLYAEIEFPLQKQKKFIKIVQVKIFYIILCRRKKIMGYFIGIFLDHGTSSSPGHKSVYQPPAALADSNIYKFFNNICKDI